MKECWQQCFATPLYSTAYFWQTLQCIARLRISFVWLFSFLFGVLFFSQTHFFFKRKNQKTKKIRSDMDE